MITKLEFLISSLRTLTDFSVEKGATPMEQAIYLKIVEILDEVRGSMGRSDIISENRRRMQQLEYEVSVLEQERVIDNNTIRELRNDFNALREQCGAPVTGMDIWDKLVAHLNGETGLPPVGEVDSK